MFTARLTTARLTVLPLLLALATLAVAAPAADAARPQLVAMASTSATSSVDEQGTGHLAGSVAGDPYDGTYTAQLFSYDGSMPADGLCEPGWAFVQVSGPKDASMELVGSGAICDKWGPDRFTGRFEVVHSSKRRFLGVEGWLGISLTDTGGSVEAYDWNG